MKRRVFCIVLTIFFALSMVFSSTRIVSAANTTKSPVKGEELFGFVVSDSTYDTVTKSTKILFIHKKTGAKVLVIQNNDINRGFSIKFNTIADNDKGMNHIIEHSVLGGSDKYPSNNIIFDVSNTTYVSFANALTYQNMTVFPICSKNEKQLLKSADIYLDAVFHPLLLSDERIFEREGFRYELSKKDADLVMNGIVYNEMQGSLGSIESAAYMNARKAIFNNSNQGNVSGGDPSAIRTLTYEELLKTYKKNYHPSNSLTVIYGDLDYKPFLKMMNEDYFSDYSKSKTNIDRGNQEGFKKLMESTYTFPVAKGTDTNNKAVIDLVFLCKDIKTLGMEDFTGLNIAVSLLNLDNSDFKKALVESKIAENYTISMDTATFQPTIHFIATKADATKKKEFYQLVLKELKKVAEKGLDSELVRSSLRSLEFQEAIGSNNNSAVNQMITASLYDNLLDNPMIDENTYYKSIVLKLDNKILERIIKQQLVNNTSAALTVTLPKAGLLEQNQKDIYQTLLKKKVSMNSKELSDLVTKTTEFLKWNSKHTSEEVLNSLKAVSLKDLPVELKDRNIQESTMDEVRLLTSNADIDDISNVNLIFDVSHLTLEELFYLKFYGEMIGSGMATEHRSESQVLNDITKKTYSVSTNTSAILDNKQDTSAHPVFQLNYYGFEDEYKDTFDLVSDILLHSKVSDLATYGTRTLANIKANYQSDFAEPLNLALYRSMAYTSPYYRYINYLNGLDYYKFILSLEKKMVENPSEVVNKITAVRDKAFHKNNLTILLAGNTGAQTKFKESLTEFTGQLTSANVQKAEHKLPVPAKREAFIINSTVQYVCMNASLSENKIIDNGKFQVITGLLNNLMLTPEIRLKGGAYGVSAFASFNNYITYTYRDSNYVNSMATIGATDEFLKQVKPHLTEDGLESYKLSAFAAETQGSGELNDAVRDLSYKMQGMTTKDRIKTLTEIKETTLADLELYMEYLARINDNSNYVVVASSAEIEKHKDLFDVIIPLQ